MTDKQPEALRLAECLDELDSIFDYPGVCGKAAAELRRLRQCCRNVCEVWEGGEGIPEPQTALGVYLLSLVEQMRDAAKEGLK